MAAAAISLPMIGSYWYRMQVEESMLADAFAQEYQSYAARTWRLIPFVY